MIKKNKLSLFLLAVVMMLSIYYINMPNETSKPTESTDVVTKYPEFAQMRLEILQFREDLVSEFENVIASADTSNIDKNEAYLSMQQVLELTENEVLLESFVMDLGYLDCLVKHEDNLISVYILNFVESSERLEEIYILVSEVFDTNTKIIIKDVKN